MDDQMKPEQAKALRKSFKEIGERYNMVDCLTGDHVEIRSPITGSPREPVQLVIMSGGELGKPIASVMVTPGVFKRLKRELHWFKNAKSGAGLAFRHGNRP